MIIIFELLYLLLFSFIHLITSMFQQSKNKKIIHNKKKIFEKKKKRNDFSTEKQCMYKYLLILFFLVGKKKNGAENEFVKTSYFKSIFMTPVFCRYFSVTKPFSRCTSFSLNIKQPKRANEFFRFVEIVFFDDAVNKILK